MLNASREALPRHSICERRLAVKRLKLSPCPSSGSARMCFANHEICMKPCRDLQGTSAPPGLSAPAN